MNIELVEGMSNVGDENMPDLLEFTQPSSSSIKDYTVKKDIYEKWLPEPKPQQELNWIIQEILSDVNDDEAQTMTKTTTMSSMPSKGDQDNSNGSVLENGQSKNVIVREYKMTALPSETGEQIQISNVIYPVCNDSFVMGRIACAALLNKLFSMKLFTCNRVVFMLAVSEKWSKAVQDSVEKLALKGFKETALEAKFGVNESEVHTDTNFMIGGMLTAISPMKLCGFPNESIIGDVLVLTKPLGVQTTLDAYQIFHSEHSEIRERLKRIISEEDMTKAYEGAISLMTTLNLEAVKLTDSYIVHAVTEINGQSLMEHAQALAEKQLNDVSFYIYNLPLIAKMLHVSKVLGTQSDLIQGNVPEISGGLLLVMPREQAAGYCRHFLNEGRRAWIIGVVEKGERTANMIKKARIIECPWKSEPIV